MPLLAAQKVHRCTTLNSNLKLASGIAPVKALSAGVNTMLGNRRRGLQQPPDMLGEIARRPLLAKGSTLDPLTVTARTALEMATIRAASAVGRAADLGSLEVGKLTDVVGCPLGGVPECRPVYHADALARREHSDVHQWPPRSAARTDDVDQADAARRSAADRLSGLGGAEPASAQPTNATRFQAAGMMGHCAQHLDSGKAELGCQGREAALAR